MLNQIILVGRLVHDPKKEELENGRIKSKITLAIPRNYKNNEGCYDTDFIECIMHNSIAQSTIEYCKKGDLVGVKGRLETTTIEDEENKKIQMYVVVERLTFLSTRKDEE